VYRVRRGVQSTSIEYEYAERHDVGKNHDEKSEKGWGWGGVEVAAAIVNKVKQ